MNTRDTKNDLIVNIMNSMSGSLKDEQLSKLKNVLYIQMNEYNIEKPGTELSVLDSTNDKILKVFLATKNMEGKSLKTLERYGEILGKMLQDINKNVVEITTWDLRAYLANYKETRHVCDNTLNGMQRIISSFFGWLTVEDYLENDPSKKLKTIKVEKKVKKAISSEEFELLKMACKNDRDLAIINLLYVSGMRIGELCALDISDINFEKKSVVVHGKGNKQREIFFNGSTKIRLQQYLSGRTDDCPALFTTLRNERETNSPRRITIKAVEMRIRDIGRDAGLEKIHAHKFRRTMATNMANKNVPVSKIAHILGHEKIQTTQEYLVNTRADVENVYRFCFD